MTEPALLVSVVMPLYNQSAFVRKAVESVLLQDWPAWELLVVDDGSTDDSAAIVDALAAQAGGKVSLIRQANSGGPAQPRNLGIARSTGDLVAFLDPDDYWHPGKLSRQVEAMRANPDAVMSFTEAQTVNADGHPLNLYLGRVGYLARAGAHLQATALAQVFRSGPRFYAYSSVDVAGPQTSGVMVRRSALAEQPRCFETDFRVGEDLDLWFRLMAAGPCLFIDAPLHAYRLHGASLMQQSVAMLSGSARCHARNYARVSELLEAPERTRLAQRIADLYGSAGWNLACQGRFPAAREMYGQALRWHVSVKHLRGWTRSWIADWLGVILKKGA